MKFLIISGTPKSEGLCAGIVSKIERGAADGGAETEIVTPAVDACHVCDEGWGQCRAESRCLFEDDGFGAIQDKVLEADVVCIVTPVYWGESSETLKSFLDRLRRCEAPLRGEEKKGFTDKMALLVVSAGGSGNGTVSALEQLDRFCQHTAMPVFDRFTFNRWNADYTKTAVYTAARKIAEGRKVGETV